MITPPENEAVPTSGAEVPPPVWSVPHENCLVELFQSSLLVTALEQLVRPAPPNVEAAYRWAPETLRVAKRFRPEAVPSTSRAAPEMFLATTTEPENEPLPEM